MKVADAAIELGRALGMALPVFGAGVVGAAVGCAVYLRLARARGWGQRVRDDGPASHLAKRGTPSMAGIVFVVGLGVAAAAWAGTGGEELLPLTVLPFAAALVLGAVGLADDVAKLRADRTTGVRARWRLLGQAVIAGAAVAATDRIWAIYGHEPMTGYLGVSWVVPTWAFGLRVAAIVGCANAVNFTDGLDGLAAGTVAIAAGSMAVVGLWLGVPVPALMLVLTAGLCLGFLPFNWHPAKLFMGDVGSMTLGGVLGVAAVVMRVEVLLVLVGAVFVAETLSVIAQVVSFQTTGKRVIRMAPLHHHLELCGWSEVQVVVAAYAVQAVAAGLAVALAVREVGGGVS